jgi:arylformamidase
MVTWPGSTGFRLQSVKSFAAGDRVNVSHLECDVHVGTHIDAPRHFLQEGMTVDQVSLNSLIGPAQVCHLPDSKHISSMELDSLSLSQNSRRLLFRTQNSEPRAMGTSHFCKDYVALTDDAARWLADHEVCLVGIDYLSVERYGDDSLIHQILLEAGIVILEGLNLADVAPGDYELICLPLYLVGSEGAPARAVLRPLPFGGYL